MLAIYTLAIIVLIIIIWHLSNHAKNTQAPTSLNNHSIIDSTGKALFYNQITEKYIYRKPTFWEKRFLNLERKTLQQ